jgi:hypothetical protein
MKEFSDPLFIQPVWHPHPDPGAYLKLKSSLYELEFVVDNKKIESLDASRASLESVITFLQLDRMCVQFRLTRSLWSLLKAVHDTSQGAKPPLLFAYKSKSKGGAPSHKTESLLRAEIIFQLRLLTHDGMKPDEASRWLASALAKAGVRQKGTVRNPQGKIGARQIARWQAEVGAKSMSGSDTAYQVLEANELAVRGWPKTIKEAQRRVLSRIHTLRKTGF